MNFCLQNWFAFSKSLKKPLSFEHGSVDFIGTNNTSPPPLDENNNAFCKVRIEKKLICITFITRLVVKRYSHFFWLNVFGYFLFFSSCYSQEVIARLQQCSSLPITAQTYPGTQPQFTTVFPRGLR